MMGRFRFAALFLAALVVFSPSLFCQESSDETVENSVASEKSGAVGGFFGIRTNALGIQLEHNWTNSVTSDENAVDLTYSNHGQNMDFDFGIQLASKRQSFFSYARYKIFDGYRGWFGPCNFTELENFSDISFRQHWFAGFAGCVHFNDVFSFQGSSMFGFRGSTFKRVRGLDPVFRKDVAGDFSFSARPWHYKNDVEFSAGIASWEMFWHPLFFAPIFFVSASGSVSENVRLKSFVGMRTFDYFGISAMNEGVTLKIGAEVLF